jgi:hypothetical protein
LEIPPSEETLLVREKVSSLEEVLRFRGWHVYEQLADEQASAAIESLFNATDYAELDYETVARRFLTVYEFVRATRNVGAIPRAFIDENTEE